MLTRLVPRLFTLLGIHRALANPAVERLYLAAFFAYKRYVEDPFAGLVRRRPELFRGGHILDIGANAGYTAAVFAAAAEAGFNVFAFEPEPANVARLRKVMTRRRVANVIPIESAVSDRDGEALLLLNPHHPGDHKLAVDDAAGSTIRVPTVTIDSFIEQRQIAPVAFVKIDVQGAELAVSRGMERLLRRQPRIAVAFEVIPDSPGDLIDFYRARDFTIGVLEHDGTVVGADPETLARAMRRRGYVDLLATRGVF